MRLLRKFLPRKVRLNDSSFIIFPFSFPLFPPQRMALGVDFLLPFGECGRQKLVYQVFRLYCFDDTPDGRRLKWPMGIYLGDVFGDFCAVARPAPVPRRAHPRSDVSARLRLMEMKSIYPFSQGAQRPVRRHDESSAVRFAHEIEIGRHKVPRVQ